MEQLVLLLIIAGISLINWLVEKSKKIREEKRLEQANSQSAAQTTAHQEETVLSPRSAPDEDSSEQMRRLLEAMGIPTEFPEQPATPEPEPVRATLPAPPPLPQAPTPPPARPSLRKKRAAAASSASQPTAWSKRLRSQAALREAIILREILGPPRALSQP